mmetsp:Transcript_81425/g.153916  ORF Transcript_81425/g.153916 Transcript_81425/m.153916 type:complete len:249 (-) Transcript_81425:235-981(-)
MLFFHSSLNVPLQLCLLFTPDTVLEDGFKISWLGRVTLHDAHLAEALAVFRDAHHTGSRREALGLSARTGGGRHLLGPHEVQQPILAPRLVLVFSLPIAVEIRRFDWSHFDHGLLPHLVICGAWLLVALTSSCAACSSIASWHAPSKVDGKAPLPPLLHKMPCGVLVVPNVVGGHLSARIFEFLVSRVHSNNLSAVYTGVIDLHTRAPQQPLDLLLSGHHWPCWMNMNNEASTTGLELKNLDTHLEGA